MKTLEDYIKDVKEWEEVFEKDKRICEKKPSGRVATRNLRYSKKALRSVRNELEKFKQASN